MKLANGMGIILASAVLCGSALVVNAQEEGCTCEHANKMQSSRRAERLQLFKEVQKANNYKSPFYSQTFQLGITVPDVILAVKEIK